MFMFVIQFTVCTKLNGSKGKRMNIELIGIQTRHFAKILWITGRGAQLLATQKKQ